MSNTRRNRHLGGGVEPKNSLFKPVVASSLALALGVSVAVATENNSSDNLDELLKQTEKIEKSYQRTLSPYSITTEPSFTIGTTPYTDYKTPVIGGSNAASQGITWQSGDNGLVYLFSQDVADNNSGDGIIKNIEINYNQSGVSQVWTGNNGTLSIRPGNTENTSVTFDSNGNGIQMGKDGTGELKLQFKLVSNVSPTTYANFTFSNDTGGDAFKGNLKIVGGYANNYPDSPITHATLIFKQNLKGNLSIENVPSMSGYLPVANITFQENSNLDGNFYADTGKMTLLFENGGITGDLTIKEIAIPTILRTSGADMTIGRDGGFIGGKITLLASHTDANFNNAYLTIGYADNTTGTKVITLNPEDSSKFEVDKGVITFQNMKKLEFVNESGEKKTLTLENGKLDQSIFNFDRELLKANENTTIIKGNINAQDGKSLRLSFIDDGTSTALDQSSLKTFTIDGSIIIEGGGLSLFYNDRTNSFEAKIKAINGGIVSQTGGYIGRNDAWFESGTFQSGKNDVLTIQGMQDGISHLKFEDTINITKGIGASGGNGTELFFNQGANISAFDGTTQINAESEGSAIYINGGGSNNITFGGSSASTITGNITATGGTNSIAFTNSSAADVIQGSILANGGVNKITANSLALNNASIIAGGNNPNSGNGGDSGAQGKNLIEISGTATLSETTIRASNRNNMNSNKYNILKFSGGLSGSIANLDAINRNSGDRSKTKNILSFDFTDDAAKSLTITNINKNVDPSNGDRASGYNYIGKGLTTGKGISLAPVSGFNDTTWKNDTYTANLNLTVSERMFALRSGKNYINVLSLTAGTISNDGGTNNINTSERFQADNIISEWSGTNNIFISKNANINTMIAGSGGGNSGGTNNITLVDTGTLTFTGNIEYGNGRGTKRNNLSFGADGGEIILKGETNQITTLTAFSNATTNGNTLIIDGSLNANSTTIDKVTDSYRITANFVGQNASTLKILGHSNGGKSITLKAITLGDSSKNNTLDLTALTQTTIANAINVGANQDLTIKVGNSSTLILTGGMTTAQQATSAINAEGNTDQVTTTIKGDNAISTSKFEVSSALGVSNLTFDKNTASSPIAFSFDSFVTEATTNNINLNSGVSSLTFGTTSNSASEDDPIVFGTISYLGSPNQSLAINGGENIINTLALNNQNNTLSIGGGSTSVSNAITASNTFAIDVGSTGGNATLSFADSLKTNGSSGATNVTFKTTSGSYASILSLGGADNYISSVATETSANGVLEATAGNTVVNTIANSDGSLTLALSSSTETPSNTTMTLNSAITKGSGSANVTFSGGTDDQRYHSNLILAQTGNTLNSVTTNAKNAKITMRGAVEATIDSISFGNEDEPSSLLFGFEGTGDSTVTIGDGNDITIGNNQTLGISIGGTGQRTIQVLVKGSQAGQNGNITFGTGSTLLVDFQATQTNDDITATLGNDSGFTIEEGSNSIINLRGGEGQSRLEGGVILNGGTNTVNFLGSTTLSNITLTKGTNIINVYGADSSDDGITGTVITTDVGGVSNTINLNDYATLDLKSDKSAGSGTGSLTSTGTGDSLLKSELNFIGIGATYKGGFGATSSSVGDAKITVGSVGKDKVSGVITGNVSYSSLEFKAGNSTLTLRGATNTLKSLSTDATNGVLVLDTTTNSVFTTSNSIETTIESPITIKKNTSLTFGLYSDNTNNYNAKVSVGGITVEEGGTLGIAIGGSGTGNREVEITGTNNSYEKMFAEGSTLRIDFLQDANGSATLGNGKPIVISENRNSQINFYGKSDANKNETYNPSLTGGITLDGGINEVNFYGDATLTGITLKSGDNTIRVKGSDAGITGTVGVSSVGGDVRNTVELERNSTLALTNDDGVGTLSNASVKVLGESTKIAGTITNASISFADNTDLTLQAGDSTISSLTSTNSQASSTYTRNGRVITRTITNTLTLDATDDNTPISATMLNAITSDNVALQFGLGSEAKTFKFQADGNTFQGVSFATDPSASTGSTNNTLEFNGTNNTITSAIDVTANNDLTIKLANTTANSNVSLNLAGGLSNASGGGANITIEGSQINATLSGRAINANTLTLGANSNTLTFQNQTATFDHVKTADSGTSISGNLIADNSTITINHLDDNHLTLGFAGENTSSVTISGDVSSGKTITLAGVELNGDTSKNTLDLTALTDTTILSKVSVGDNQALSINLGTTTLNLSEGLDTQGTSTIGVKNDSSATLTGKAVSLSTLSLGNASSTMILKNSQSTINSVSATSGGILKVDASSNAVLATISGDLAGNSLSVNLKGTSDNSATLQLNGANNQISTLNFDASSSNNKVILNGDLTIANKVTDNTSATFDLNSSALTLGADGMDVTGGTTTFNLSGTSAINGDLTLNNGNVNMNLSGNSTFTLANNPTKSGTGNFNFAFKGSNATLNVNTDKLSLDTLTSNGSNTINLVTEGRDTTTSNTTFKFLDIGSMNGGSVKTTLFVNKDTGISDQTLGDVDANSNNSTAYGYAHSDRVVVNGGINSSNLVLSVVPNLDQLLDLTYSGNNGTGDSGNIALATVKKNSGVQVSSESVTIGFDVVEAQLQEVITDEKGNADNDGNYLTYFLGGAVSKGASVETQEVAQSALAVSYDLFLANFNSLNKRMGELRDNNHDNGVWARVFGGAISNDFGAGSKTQYVTTQAGYDYSLSVGDNARNYMGIAVAYGHSNTQSNTLTQSGSVFGSTQTIGLDKVSSNMVEVGLYNSYVADSGWYNDTIFKFDYIMSEFALSNDLSKMTKTNNFAMILSDEFGYRYSFGVSEKGSWYIDPQAEVGFGWFNQSDFNRSLESSFGTSTLKASQDAILTLRTRVGASLGKKFNTDKGFASLYVGAFYEYDYIEGGNTEVTSGSANSATTNNFLQQIESNGRAILNVGSNIELTKGARLYIDVEKSFGDKQRTFMQFNLGARYSF